MKAIICSVMLAGWWCSANAFAQRKPERAEAPKFTSGQLSNVFFPDVASQLKGPRPSSSAAANATPKANANGGETPTPLSNKGSVTAADSGSDPLAWHKLISPTALEDLIKGSKLRLDKTITTPAAFAGGGFAIARKEFSLQALLFAIVETYPSDVRWKNSAPLARELMSRVAANTKVGSAQVYDEAKKRLIDLDDLANGSALVGKANSEIDWSKLVDHAPLMQLLEWAQQESISPYTASPEVFAKHKDALLHQAELVAVLGKVLTVESMPFADDKEYVALAKAMIEQSQQVVLAVKSDDAELARQSAAKIGQSCTNCHDSFR